MQAVQNRANNEIKDANNKKGAYMGHNLSMNNYKIALRDNQMEMRINKDGSKGKSLR